MSRPCERMPIESPVSPVGRVLALPFVGLIHLYRLTLSPFIGGHCRHIPTCSCYGLEAYRLHGPIRGTALTAWRILRCQPFCRGGWDPVPVPVRNGTAGSDSTPGGATPEAEVSND
ncbi:MAG: membrane protein insertion efficiency factor YidD [Planctomycetota bacterium]